MDQSHNGACGGTQHEPSARSTLRKKKSLVHIRSESIGKQPRPITAPTLATDGTTSYHEEYSTPGKPVGTSQRKGSLRNVVRKIFGRSRSSRLERPDSQHSTPPRHKYHKSEPSGLPPPQEEFLEPSHEQGTRTPQRVLSAPVNIEIPLVFNSKSRSPYAVEFPKSARLKPLDMSSPFDAPGAPLRRRKTLPSLLISGDDAVAIASAAKRSEMPPMPARASAEGFRPSLNSDIGVATTTGVKEKRRSRSANGARIRERLDSGVADEPERKRSAEIRFWRESYPGSVLRASGFTVPFSVPPQEEQERDDKWQTMAGDQQESVSPTRRVAGSPRGLRITSHSRQDTLGTLDGSTALNSSNYRSTSGLDMQTSRDLENRVAHLEANVQLFQRSLQKMQADRNRRTVIVGDYPPMDNRQSYRTPSMLADDLRVPTDYSQERFDPEPEPCRPSTAPHSRSPIAEHPPVPPIPDNRRGDYSPEPSPTTTTRPANPARKPSNLITTNPNVAFKSLYQMLSDERCARRRLETQMRTLHTEIQDLQHQVSASTSYSHRSSYMLSHEATIASSRLRDLLRETESQAASPEATPRKQRQVYVSRFSGSTTGVREIDDDHGNDVGDDERSVEDEDEAQTPHEDYKTPREEQSPFKFERDGEMF
ncbi:hypothetical protein Q7P37_003415 [Cladosporium fusiforme]